MESRFWTGKVQSYGVIPQKTPFFTQSILRWTEHNLVLRDKLEIKGLKKKTEGPLMAAQVQTLRTNISKVTDNENASFACRMCGVRIEHCFRLESV